MKNRLLACGLLLMLSALIAPTMTRAAHDVKVVMFYGQGCPHCGVMESHLQQLQNEYPTLDVVTYEVYSNRNNIALFEQYAEAYNHNIGGVPTIYIDKRVVVGARQNEVDSLVADCVQNGCIDPMAYVSGQAAVPPSLSLPPDLNNGPAPSQEPSSPGQANAGSDNGTTPEGQDGTPTSGSLLPAGLTLPAVISAAIVDAINPCAFAVLIILMTTILATNKRRRALHAGLAFSASIFISYLLMGLGLYSAIQAAGISKFFYIIIGVLAILIGLFNLKDYFWYGKWFVMEVPLSWRPKMKALIKSVTSTPGAFLVGFLVSLFLLPCTSGPYIVILGMLAGSADKSVAIPLLALYNAIFVLPMILITVAVSHGVMSPDKAEAWRQKRLKHLHLIAGLIILTLGIIMLISASNGS